MEKVKELRNANWEGITWIWSEKGNGIRTYAENSTHRPF